MAPIASNLSGPQYGYDFVVSTTQESINAGLVQYLQNTQGKQPPTYLCYTADDQGDPTVASSLDEIKQQSGVDPFEIPDGTDTSDARIQSLLQVRFSCAVRLQVGIPPGLIQFVPGKGPQLQLPQPIVTLGTISDNVAFTLYCSDVTVIKFDPPGGYSKGSWKWYSQPSGKPWYVTTKTDIKALDLDKDTLDTPYLNKNPDVQQALRDKLGNISGSAFSLQQLFYDLDNAVAQSAPTFVGVDDKTANYLLGLTFISQWSLVAKEQGLPLIAVTAVATQPDGSPLRVTGLERSVSPVIDPLTGQRLPNPTVTQLAATTLNYLCAANGNSLPGATSFTWNWVDPDAQDLAQSSGVISIKRNTIAQYLVDQMLPYMRLNCIQPWTKVEATDVVGGITFSWNFFPGQEPTVTYTDSGPAVASVSYSNEARASDSDAATYGELNITSSYTCDIVFGSFDNSVSPPRYIAGNKFTISQNLKVSVYTQWSHTGASADVVNKTLTDEYVISVDDHGSLSTTPIGVHTSADNSNLGDRSAFVDFWTGVNDMLSDVSSQSKDFLSANITAIPFNETQNFVFPGAQVFSYATATFSDFQDLVSLITYVNPTDNQFKPMAMAATALALAPQVMEVADPPPIAKYLETIRGMGLLGPPLAPHQTDNGDSRGLFGPATLLNGSPEPLMAAAKMANAGQNINGMAAPAPSAPAPAAAPPSVKTQLSSSTEMILNYVQGELVQPEGKFRALQMDDGNALLFAVDSGGVFNVIKEVTGQTQTGWIVNDLSSYMIKGRFPSGGVVRAFDVAQSVMGGNTIGLGMAVRVGTSDTLFLSLLNAPTSASLWLSGPNW